jgi:hypothetical protein
LSTEFRPANRTHFFAKVKQPSYSEDWEEADPESKMIEPPAETWLFPAPFQAKVHVRVAPATPTFEAQHCYALYLMTQGKRTAQQSAESD